jgi:hypothetical protein
MTAQLVGLKAWMKYLFCVCLKHGNEKQKFQANFKDDGVQHLKLPGSGFLDFVHRPVF